MLTMLDLVVRVEVTMTVQMEEMPSMAEVVAEGMMVNLPHSLEEKVVLQSLAAAVVVAVATTSVPQIPLGA
jgi:hypothetical protein